MPIEYLNACPICKGTQFDLFMDVEDHSVSHGTFKITRCRQCDFLLTNPRPDETDIHAYYDSENYISHHDNDTSPLAILYQYVRKVAVKSKLNLVKKYDPEQQKTILDIGCGTGFFLKSSKEMGWNTYGTEPDHDARHIARSVTQSVIEDSVFHFNLANKNFSTITLWHVLEHVHRLEETMDWLHNHLLPDGTVIIAVPNPQSYDAVKFADYWAAYDVPRHLYHFTRNAMSNLLKKHGFSLIDSKGMPFDSYYVSLLSNRYKHGNNRIIDSFLTGSLSLLKGYAFDHEKLNTSSIIYIAKKLK